MILQNGEVYLLSGAVSKSKDYQPWLSSCDLNRIYSNPLTQNLIKSAQPACPENPSVAQKNVRKNPSAAMKVHFSFNLVLASLLLLSLLKL